MKKGVDLSEAKGRGIFQIMPKPKTKTPEEKINALLAKVRPYIKMHGGDVVLLGFKDGIVKLQISGACKDCRMADLTYNSMVGELLKEEVAEVREVEIIK